MSENQNLDIEFLDFSYWRELILLGSSLSQPLTLSSGLNPCGNLFPWLINSTELWQLEKGEEENLASRAELVPVTRCSHHRYRDAGEVVGFSDLSSVGEGCYLELSRRRSHPQTKHTKHTSPLEIIRGRVLRKPHAEMVTLEVEDFARRLNSAWPERMQI
ncbi:hypothetical protein JHK87_001069 [Glycine soja]|nr:hypothetical protein JHK87_001069 [Glycine soja]